MCMYTLFHPFLRISLIYHTNQRHHQTDNDHADGTGFMSFAYYPHIIQPSLTDRRTLTTRRPLALKPLLQVLLLEDHR